jgi:hypothetical protein
MIYFSLENHKKPVKIVILVQRQTKYPLNASDMCYHCANLLPDCTNRTKVEVKQVNFHDSNSTHSSSLH